jgi:hypothetical protein
MLRQYYTLERLEKIYRCQEPGLAEQEVKVKARILHRHLNTMEICWARSNQRFYTHNLLRDFSQDYI